MDFPWVVRIAMTMVVSVFTKILTQTRQFRDHSPLTQRAIEQLYAEIETHLNDYLPEFDPRDQILSFPQLNDRMISRLNTQGFVQASDQIIEVEQTQRSYRIFYDHELGRGGFGTTYLGQDMHSGEWVAAKVQPCVSPSQELNILTENHHLLLDHKLLGQVKNKKELITVMPLFVKDDPRLENTQEKIAFFLAVAQELQRLHAYQSQDTETRRLNGQLYIMDEKLNALHNQSREAVDYIDVALLTREKRMVVDYLEDINPRLSYRMAFSRGSLYDAVKRLNALKNKVKPSYRLTEDFVEPEQSSVLSPLLIRKIATQDQAPQEFVQKTQDRQVVSRFP